eukprot:TRINITY_DN907_c0_g1_i11.p1 TRINITY_DN907_c0_g1~~TRINITY_DN907_c0_g1_i11.p1  ORF type:complete len:187 (+),score=-36.26 TRINITY_DN907_c0_g1_i11:68-562(+)
MKFIIISIQVLCYTTYHSIRNLTFINSDKYYIKKCTFQNLYKYITCYQIQFNIILTQYITHTHFLIISIYVLCYTTYHSIRNLTFINSGKYYTNMYFLKFVHSMLPNLVQYYIDIQFLTFTQHYICKVQSTNMFATKNEIHNNINLSFIIHYLSFHTQLNIHKF